MSIRAGAARRLINCEIGDDLCGQYHRRYCQFIRDDLEANFLYLAEGDEQVLRHAVEDVEIALRMPDAEALARAEETVALGPEKAGRRELVDAASLLRLHREFGAHPVEKLAVHALRVGDFGLATNPCELYCQYGLDIKRRSPAAVTAVAQLTDGFSGYCPTIPALLGGGYSVETIYWCRLEPYAGYRLVEASARLLNRIWQE